MAQQTGLSKTAVQLARAIKSQPENSLLQRGEEWRGENLYIPHVTLWFVVKDEESVPLQALPEDETG
jgi:hypothetical protein